MNRSRLIHQAFFFLLIFAFSSADTRANGEWAVEITKEGSLLPNKVYCCEGSARAVIIVGFSSQFQFQWYHHCYCYFSRAGGEFVL